jgi:hypothetical protein
VIGSAKYEPEHGAILWRIGQYIESTLPHNFRCDIQLKSGETVGPGVVITELSVGSV